MRMNLFLFPALVFALLAACAPKPETLTAPPEPTPAPKVGVLVWERDGGIAGFCDKVVIYSDASATISDCKGLKMEIRLTTAQEQELRAWVGSLGKVTYQHTDGPGAADAMTIILTFTGSGTGQADDATLQELLSFAAEVQLMATVGPQGGPQRAEAEQALRDFLSALNTGDYVLAAKLYGGSTGLLQTWNPDVTDNLPALLERACTQNGLQCLVVSSVSFRGYDARGGYQFLVEFENADGSLFVQGPCCGETSGATFTRFTFRVVPAESGMQVLDLPPYVP